MSPTACACQCMVVVTTRLPGWAKSYLARQGDENDTHTAPQQNRHYNTLNLNHRRTPPQLLYVYAVLFMKVSVRTISIGVLNNYIYTPFYTILISELAILTIIMALVICITPYIRN